MDRKKNVWALADKVTKFRVSQNSALSLTSLSKGIGFTELITIRCWVMSSPFHIIPKLALSLSAQSELEKHLQVKEEVNFFRRIS